MCSCLKSLALLLFRILNFAAFICGAALIGVGIWLLLDDSAVKRFNELDLEGVVFGSTDDPLWVAMCATILAVGCFLFLVGLFGCCGIKKKSSCFLCLYVIFVAGTLALLLTIIIIAAVGTGIVDVIGGPMKNQLQTEYGPNETAQVGTTTTWNLMQAEKECCGSFGYTDWQESQFFNESPEDRPVPYSCCRMNPGTRDAGTPGDVRDIIKCRSEAWGNHTGEYTELHNLGCAHAIQNKINSEMDVVIAICAIIMGVQIFGIVIACVQRGEYKAGKAVV